MHRIKNQLVNIPNFILMLVIVLLLVQLVLLL